MRKDYTNKETNYVADESVPFGYTVAPTSPADSGYDPGRTMPVEESYGYEPTAPIAEPPRYAPTEVDYEDHAKTEVAGMMDVSGRQVQPVVGWLVGIQGPARGVDFRLYSGRNFIGRGSGLEVSIEDMHISREPVVQVAYDPRSKTFLTAPCDNRNHCLSYLNGELLMTTNKLKAYDRLMIGDASELMFVPLCGPDFDWKESE